MSLNRREFLKTAAAGSGGLLLGTQARPAAAAPAPLPHDAVGILYDATLCIGCKSCMVNCKKFNTAEAGALALAGRTAPPYETTGAGIWDEPRDLSSKTLNIIKVYKSGTAVNKDAVKDGYSFVKQHCMHCAVPACVSVCPVGALQKDPVNGIVFYEESRCIGCRYCQIACPYRIVKYEFESASPRVRKCQLCRHRIAEGKYAACCEFCPTGASIFGRVDDLQAEAARRLALQPGTEYKFPVQTAKSTSFSTRQVARYEKQVYGLREAGGTQYLLLAGVPFELLGFDPHLGDKPLSDATWTYISHIPALIVGVAGVGAVTWAVTRRRDAEKEG